MEAAEFGRVDILKISGKPLGEDHPTMAVIRVYVGGNVPESTWYEYIILEGGILAGGTKKFEIKWAGQISEPKDLDGDGILEFTVGRWPKLDGCHPCWKDRQAIIGLRDGEFVPVCKAFPNFFHANIKWNKMFYDGQSNRENLLEVIAELALSHAQIGENGWAEKYAREYVAILGVSAHPLLDTVLRAKALAHLQCPVEAILNDDPHWRRQ